ncbi:hypothetical protein [Salinibacterium sp. ZJ454]|uniref:hypothetical protein n=1 Tax=Salinibacterium sp. ZJ454 TaxID=2708339 RepID=UPI00141F1C24|nr:hypothetical protein [Salinibacterium sp. ZJ454]
MIRSPDQAVADDDAPVVTGHSRVPLASALLIAGAAVLLIGVIVTLVVIMMNSPRQYPWHTNIVATTFWVGEVFDPNADDGSQVISTYDGGWYANYGGCDGVITGGVCETEPRTADNGYFPHHIIPQENPFYLDLPYDDVNDPEGFAMRGSVIPWADDAPYRDRIEDRDFSLMKNRWVRIRANGRTCYGQIQDAGPGEYHDAQYVFGTDDARPANQRYNNAGMDVSPALNGCLRFKDLNGENDRVNWQFVEFEDVPEGPWLRIVTTSGVNW